MINKSLEALNTRGKIIKRGIKYFVVRKDLKGDTDCQPEFLTAEDLKLHLGSYDIKTKAT